MVFAGFSNIIIAGFIYWFYSQIIIWLTSKDTEYKAIGVFVGLLTVAAHVALSWVLMSSPYADPKNRFYSPELHMVLKWELLTSNLIGIIWLVKESYSFITKIKARDFFVATIKTILGLSVAGTGYLATKGYVVVASVFTLVQIGLIVNPKLIHKIAQAIDLFLQNLEQK